MSIRGIGDGLAFQRLLWLLVATVVVPTVLLALYGVMAIRNQRSAYVERARVVQSERLSVISDRVAERVASLRDSASACGTNTRCLGAIQGIADVSASPAEASGPWEHVPGSDPPLYYLIDLDALDAEIRLFGAQRWNDPDVAFRLAEVGTGPSYAVAAFVADLPLKPPLSAYRVTVSFTEDSPASAFFGRTVWLYTTGLVVLVALVLVGTVVTLRSAAREIQLSRLQTDFVSSVSHELRTPLTSIRMFVDTLQSGRLEDPERVDECLKLVAVETDRLSRMIERVLGWARMEAGRRVYDQESVPAEALVEEALQALKTQQWLADDSGTQIEVALPADLPQLYVDRDAIVEALLNLLTNAVKYAPAPRVIRIAGTARKGVVGLTVSDNGPGIARRERKRVWEKFYQSDHRLSSPHQGSGLGLAIVRAVVRGHGGRVELVSDPGHGCAFALWLPAASGSS